MPTKIDYIAIYNPIAAILKIDDLPAEQRIQIVLELMDKTKKEAGEN